MSGEMLWYEGEGVYKDGQRVSSLDLFELVDLLIQHEYIVIQSEQTFNANKCKESRDGSSKQT